MFNLDEAIAKWRRQMAAGGITTPAVLDELESHLREDISSQMRAGESEERSFAAAAQKLGTAHALKNEFRKNGFAFVLETLMIAIAVLVAAFGVFLTTATMLLCYETTAERLIGFAALGSLLLAVFGWPRLVPFLPAIFNRRKRLAIEVASLAAGFGLCTFYVQVIVRQFERPEHAIPVSVFFGILPIAIGFGVASAIEQARRKAIQPARA